VKKNIVKKYLSTERPDLAEEWDYELNCHLTPDMVTIGSNKKVFWHCKNCGQSWSATVFERSTHNTGCPYDSGKLPTKGVNDLATLRPDIAEEWDYELNGALTPDMVTVASGRKVFWHCKNCGQSWQAKISNRSVQNNGCPYDSGKLPTKGVNDLATLRPDIAEEWDYALNGALTPDMVTVASGKKVFWRCKNCHRSWEASIINRSSHNSGCPYDSGNLPMKGVNDLETLRPDIAKEWDHELNGALAPNMVSITSHKKVFWRCKNCGQSWQARISDRSAHNHGCPYDSGKLPTKGVNDLATLLPNLMEEWDYELNKDITPDMVTVNSNKKVFWRCKNCGQSWQARIFKRSTYNSGCPYDSGKLPIKGVNDLATLRPDLVEEWDYKLNGDLTPDRVKISSNKKVFWRCKNCHQSWQAAISNRSTHNTGCPYDRGKLPIKGVNDLATLRPDLAEEWDYEKNEGLTPDVVTVFSGKRVFWRCNTCHHSWRTPIFVRSRHNTMCSSCRKNAKYN